MLTVCLHPLCVEDSFANAVQRMGTDGTPQDSSAHACRTVNTGQNLSPGGWKTSPGLTKMVSWRPPEGSGFGPTWAPGSPGACLGAVWACFSLGRKSDVLNPPKGLKKA